MNESAFDKWTLVHIAAGIVAGAANVPAKYAFAGAVAYEVVEYAHEWPRGSALFGSKRPESIANVITDLAVFAGGYYGGRWLRSRGE